jgi:hypothetical protein
MKESVFDPARRQRVANTPEEGVRQWLIKLLSSELGYPLHLMSCEYPMNMNGKRYRADLVVFDKGANPVLIAECKAPDIAINNDVFRQILTYNIVLKVKYILVTNGNATFLAKVDPLTGEHSFLDTIPNYTELLKQ